MGLAGDDTTEEDGLRFGVDEGALTTLRDVDGPTALRDAAEGALTALPAVRGLGRPTSLCARGVRVAFGGLPAELGDVSCVKSMTLGVRRGVLVPLRWGLLDGVPPLATMCRGGGGQIAASAAGGFGPVRRIGGGNSDAALGFGGVGGPCSGRLVRRSGMLGGRPMCWNAIPDGPALGVLFSRRRGSSGSDCRESSGRTRWRESGCANCGTDTE